MLCISVPTVPHFYFLAHSSTSQWLPWWGVVEALPDEDETDASVRAPASLLLPSSPVANKSHALPQTRKSMAGWDICIMMCLAGGSGLEAIVDADAAMTPQGLPVASERAGGESRSTGLKRKAGEIIRSAAEDLCCSPHGEYAHRISELHCRFSLYSRECKFRSQRSKIIWIYLKNK